MAGKASGSSETVQKNQPPRAGSHRSDLLKNPQFFGEGVSLYGAVLWAGWEVLGARGKMPFGDLEVGL